MTEENNTQTEEKIVLGGRSTEIVKCAKCGKEITVEERHSFEGENGEDIYFCNTCMEEINKELEEETKNPNMLGAIALGSIAGIIGCIIWFIITSATKTSFGILAIGLGWLIGKAVSLGAGNKKGLNLQLLAAGIMIVFLLLSEYLIYLYLLGKEPNLNMSVPVLFAQIISSGMFLKMLVLFIKWAVSPIGLIIWGFGIYMAYIVPKPTKL